MVGMQQFNLRWNNYTSNILQVFTDHLSSELLVDVTLSCQGRFVRAHKIILSACSPYFQELFLNHTDKHPIIILKDIKHEDLQSIIKFMYTGEIRVQEAQLDDLLKAAETLQVKGLSNVRSKYERGEITSLNPAPKPVSVKTAESAVAKKELPLQSIKATVALFAPTSTTTRGPNAVDTALALATPVPSTGTRALSASDTMTRIPASTFNAANIGTGTAASVGPALAIATLVPTNTIVPVSQANNSILRTATTLSLSTTTSTTITVSADPTTSASLISSTCTTPSTDTPIITCVTGNFLDPRDSKPVGNDFVIYATDSVPIAEQFRLPSIYTAAASTSGTTATEKKPASDAQPSRVRKRRKMSHIVNELARETVFASNGTVLLEPDDAVSKNRTKASTTSTSLRTDVADTSAETEEITVQKMRVKIQTKRAQESLLIKEKKPTKIPRPPNAFMIFANEWRRKLAIEYPKDNNKNISVRLGIMWKALSIKAKETYYRLARKVDQEHKRKYPDYHYNPKEARLRKTLKHDLMITKCLTTSSKDMDGLQMIKAFVNGEEREITEITDSSEYDDGDDYEDCEEVEEEEEHDDDVIVDEYSEVEDNPPKKPHSNSKRRTSAPTSNKVNSSKT